MKIIYLENGPLTNYRKVVDANTTEYTPPEAPHLVYVKTDRLIAGEEVFVVQA